ncbi:MAG: hypothetical protein RL095_1196 [Verrucomicrobiota bacterium]|jgi:Ca-activated chloride channel family protein
MKILPPCLALVLSVASCGQHSAQRSAELRCIASVKSGDRHLALDDSRFQAASQVRTSTFSVDVDSASFTYCRRLLEAGRLPPPDAVRSEEFINYFRYDYAAPAQGVALDHQLVDCPWDRRTSLLRIHLKASEAEAAAPRHLVLLVDVSGSMAGERLELVKRCTRELVERLGPESRISLLTYSDGVEELCRAVPCDPRGRRELVSRLESLRARGSTAGAAALQQAYDLARRESRSNEARRVVIATDGDFNVGPSSDQELLRLIGRERGEGIYLSVLGVGSGNLNDAMMEKVAGAGNGSYFHLDRSDEAARLALKMAGGSLIPVADDVRLQVEFNPERVRSWRLVGYSDRQMRDGDFDDAGKDAGDLAAGEEVTALYELELASGAAPGAKRLPSDLETAESRSLDVREELRDEILNIRLGWKAAGESRLRQESFPLDARRSCPDRAFELAIAAAAFAEYLRGRREGCFSAAEVRRRLDALPDCRGRDELRQALDWAEKAR